MMSDFAAVFSGGIFLPAIVLALLGWVVPYVLSRFFPEGVGALIALGGVAALVMVMLSALVFLTLYLLQGTPMEVLFSEGAGRTILSLGRLSLLSSLVWAPILVLSVANLPRRWVTKTW